MTFLFWNLNKKPLQQLIANLAVQHEIDVLVFVECNFFPASLLKLLNRENQADYFYLPSQCDKVQIFARFPNQFAPPVFESSRFTIRHVSLPSHTNFLLVATHFPSKLHWSDASQATEATLLSSEIKSVELQIGHNRTIFVGDFNMNPFEDDMVKTDGFHAVMDGRVASGIQRTVQERSFPYFYNPMWSLLGDISPGPSGTFYYRSSTHKAYFWNMFDQVLIRPELLSRFRTETLRILDTDGSSSFVNSRGTPDKGAASDHLPILFTMDLQQTRL